MLNTGVDSLNASVEKAHLWLRDLGEEGGLFGEAQAYSILRAVLHALRDRLTVDETAHLASHLPMLIRGMYYEGWKPARSPSRLRSLQEFLGDVAHRLGNAEVDPEVACRTVFRFLDTRINRGELEDVRHMLPAEIRALWEEAPAHPRF